MAAPPPQYNQGPPPQYGPPPGGYGPPPPGAYGAHPGYGYGPPPPMQQQQQQQQTVVVAGVQPTTIVQTRKERFSDQICVNCIITLFFPFWIIVWIIMCIVE